MFRRRPKSGNPQQQQQPPPPLGDPGVCPFAAGASVGQRRGKKTCLKTRETTRAPRKKKKNKTESSLVAVEESREDRGGWLVRLVSSGVGLG